MRRHELTDKQWEKVKDLLPAERNPQGVRPAKDNRVMLNGIIYWLATGIPWRDLPERFGPWQSVYSRYRAWERRGVFENLLAALTEHDVVDESALMLDSTMIKVHQHASGSKKGSMKRKPGGAGAD